MCVKSDQSITVSLKGVLILTNENLHNLCVKTDQSISITLKGVLKLANEFAVNLQTSENMKHTTQSIN